MELGNADELREAIRQSGLTYDEIAREIKTTRWRKRETHRKGDDSDSVSQSLIAKMASGAREMPRRERHDRFGLPYDSIRDDLVDLLGDEDWIQGVKNRRDPMRSRGPYRKRSH